MTHRPAPSITTVGIVLFWALSMGILAAIVITSLNFGSIASWIVGLAFLFLALYGISGSLGVERAARFSSVASNLALVAIIVSIPWITTAASRAEITAVRAQLKSAAEQLIRLSGEVEALKEERTTLQTQLSEAGRRHAELEGTVQALGKTVETAAKEKAELSRQVETVEKEKAELSRQVRTLQKALGLGEALVESLDFQTRVTVDEFLRGIAASGKRTAIEEAFRLKEEGVPFLLKGGDPRKGLDPFGYITQVLRAGGALSETKAFDLKVAKSRYPKVRTPAPGDILIFPGDYTTIYLGQNRAIGMTPFGVAIQKTDKLAPLLILRPPYQLRP